MRLLGGLKLGLGLGLGGRGGGALHESHGEEV